MDLLDNDLVNTVFSYVPNTAATSFYGLIDGIHEIRRDLQADALSKIDVKNDGYLKLGMYGETSRVSHTKSRHWRTLSSSKCPPPILTTTVIV